MRHHIVCGLFWGLTTAASTASATGAAFDPSPAWPLCGRIAAAPPPGWNPQQGCPAIRHGNPGYADYPLSSSFGPRQKASEAYRYDFHRGIDIPTPAGTPVFAIADGTVQIAGTHASYTDALVQLRHWRPGQSSCATVGCYFSNYMHLSGWVVSNGQSVRKGQLLGYTGSSGSGFEHLHFEIRNAPASDPYSAWQRDAIHPLRVLPYEDGVPPSFELQLLASTPLGPDAARLTFSVRQASVARRLDLTRIEATPLDAAGAPIPQPGNSPDANGYYVAPSFFDFEQMNFSYSHKNSASVPWSSFASCPYAADHPASYNANVHLDRPAADNASHHDFNATRLEPAPYAASTPTYRIDGSFDLRGINPGDYCVRLSAHTARSQVVSSQTLCVKP